MANTLFHNYANKMLGLAAAAHTLPDMDTTAFRFVLVDHADDTPVPATDQDLADITTGSSLVATSASLTGAILASTAVDFPDFAFATVTGDQAESLVLYDWATATAATAPLIAYFDTATGLPVTPNGADINVAFNALGLYKLVA